MFTCAKFFHQIEINLFRESNFTGRSITKGSELRINTLTCAESFSSTKTPEEVGLTPVLGTNVVVPLLHVPRCPSATRPLAVHQNLHFLPLVLPDFGVYLGIFSSSRTFVSAVSR